MLSSKIKHSIPVVPNQEESWLRNSDRVIKGAVEAADTAVLYSSNYHGKCKCTTTVLLIVYKRDRLRTLLVAARQKNVATFDAVVQRH